MLRYLVWVRPRRTLPTLLPFFYPPAASSDPCFGCGLSLTVRDVRVLQHWLLGTDDWNMAAPSYAAEHDRYYGALHTVISWLRTVL
jgi:hypothetical protein